MNTIGERVRYARKEARLSQRALAAKIGVSQPTLSDLEAGESQTTSKLPEIERETGFRAQWLATGRGAERIEGAARTGARLQLVADSGFTYLERLNVSASMGTGAVAPDHVEVVQNISVNLNHLRRQVSFTSPANLRFITGYGDSMSPTFVDGDPLLVDTGISDIKIDAVYVLELNNELYIKRLQRRPSGEILMISDNKNYEPYLIKNGDLEHFAVRGRVLLAWNARRL